MRSLRLRALAAVVKPVMRWRMARADDPVPIRRMLNRASRYIFREPPFALYLPTTYQSNQPRDGLWVSAGVSRSDKVILYLHGGGFLAGTPWEYRKLVVYLCRAAGMKAFVPSYRLAPEHPLPQGYDDVLAAHEHLLGLGYAPSDIVIGGDSAGGALTFAVLATLCARGQQPAAVFGWSPCLDLTYSGASIRDNAARDHLFPGDRVHDLARMILGNIPADDPRISPLFADFPDCPAVLLQVADTEILLDDSTRMEAKLRQQGTAVRLETWQAAPHVWHMLCGYLPEAQQAVDNTARFIRDQTGGR